MLVSELAHGIPIEEVGGKAFGLALLKSQGVRVPQSLVITRAALAAFLRETSLGATVQEFLSTPPSTTSVDLQSRFERLSQQVLEAPLPARLRDEFVSASQRILQGSTVGVAVRSSAMVEDASRASCAGVFESFLGLTTTDAIVHHIKLCWCSLWSPRAIRYYRRMGIDCPLDGMAVILQSVVAARIAGVILTAEPRTGNPWEFRLHATRGLSIDLLSGSGEGMTVTADWSSGTVIASEDVPSRRCVIATRNGLVTDNSAEPHADPTVTEREIQHLVEIAREIDETQNRRMDIEWVIDDLGVHIVQARPLTALPEFFPHKHFGDDDRTWQLAPLFVAARTDTPQGLVTPMYADLSEAEHWRRHQPDDIVFTTMWTNERTVNGYRYYEPEEPRTFLDCFDRPADCEPWLEDHEAAYRGRWSNRGEELAVIRDKAFAVIQDRPPASAMATALFEVRDHLWDLVSFGWSGPQALGWMCEGVLQAFLRERSVAIQVNELLYNDASAHTLRVAVEFQRLGRLLRELPEGALFATLPTDQIMPRVREESGEGEFLRQLETTLWSIGRCPPSWFGRPEFWWTGDDLLMISALRRAMNGQGRDATLVHEEVNKARRQRCSEVRNALRDQDRVRFDRLLGWTNYWSQALNDRHGLAVGQLWERELVWATGLRLVDDNVIDTPIDILVLDRSDLQEQFVRGGGEARTIVNAKRHEYARNRRLTAPHMLGSSRAAVTLLPWESQDQKSSSDTQSGIGFVSGTVSGRARLVTDLDDAALLDSLQPNDILVLPYPDAFPYVDWHSLLLAVAGVVSVGRPAHHLVQVARECRVPIVGHVSAAAIEGLDGCEIMVDGAAGVISAKS